MTTVSFLFCSYTAWQAGHRERLLITFLCLKGIWKKKKKCTLALLSRGSDGWGSDLFVYRWASAKEWKKYSGEEFSNGRMCFKDSFYYTPTTSGGVTGQGEYTINNEVSWGKNCCILRENCGWDSQECHLYSICFWKQVSHHFLFNWEGFQLFFFFFFLRQITWT